MSHRAGLEMLCTSDLQAAVKGPKVGLRRRTGRGRGKTQNSRGRDGRRATGILHVFIFNGKTHCVDSTDPKFRLFLRSEQLVSISLAESTGVFVRRYGNG